MSSISRGSIRQPRDHEPSANKRQVALYDCPGSATTTKALHAKFCVGSVNERVVGATNPAVASLGERPRESNQVVDLLTPPRKALLLVELDSLNERVVGATNPAVASRGERPRESNQVVDILTPPRKALLLVELDSVNELVALPETAERQIVTRLPHSPDQSAVKRHSFISRIFSPTADSGDAKFHELPDEFRQSPPLALGGKRKKVTFSLPDR